jgi:hypothetical protein
MGYRDPTMDVRRHIGMPFKFTGIAAYADADPEVAGTFLTTPTEAEVVTGGQTITITLADGTWIDTGFDDVRQAILDAFDSAQAEAGGWDAQLAADGDVTDVVRTSDTVVTITLPAMASYVITADEDITFTPPREAIEGEPESLPQADVISIVAGA